ncbi:MAG TPA: hypothetical protein VN513_09845, partial [Gemmatimonadales bacterium]|nr:hypothetical protein [Gemmatimonadales bacterium]
PGTKTWRESRARNDRTPFRNELEIARTVMCRAVYTGNAETVKLAGDELWDMALTFSKYVARIIADAKLAVWDDSERVA